MPIEERFEAEAVGFASIVGEVELSIAQWTATTKALSLHDSKESRDRCAVEAGNEIRGTNEVADVRVICSGSLLRVTRNQSKARVKR